MLGNLLAPTRLPWQGIVPSGTPCLPRFLRVRGIRLAVHGSSTRSPLEIPGENPPGPMSPEKNKAGGNCSAFQPIPNEWKTRTI